LNIVVCIKSVPGYITGININQTGERLEPAARTYCINETDEYAIDEALVLRSRHGGRVTVISAGPVSSEEQLRVAIAKGADQAFRIDLSTDDPEITSKALSGTIHEMQYDLVLTGLESVDTMAAQVGVATAEMLGIPFIFAATKIEVIQEHNTAIVTKELGNAVTETLEISLPALICVQTGIQKLTYTPVAKLLLAKRRGIDIVQATDLPLEKETLAKKGKWKYLEIVQACRKNSAKYLEGTLDVIASEIITRIKEVL
jgi:electron transfer flavoprotein beta subunit